MLIPILFLCGLFPEMIKHSLSVAGIGRGVAVFISTLGDSFFRARSVCVCTLTFDILPVTVNVKETTSKPMYLRYELDVCHLNTLNPS